MSEGEVVDCPACGPMAWKRWRKEGDWSIVRCRGCGLLITWPRPDAAVLDRFYAARDYYAEGGMSDSSPESWLARTEGILQRVPERVSSVFDVGAGEGHLVAAFKRLGVRADGFEPSSVGRKAALSLYGLSLRDSLPREIATYDFVTLIHSLEHMAEPLRVLEHLAKTMTAGGWMLIEVPHAGTIEVLRRQRRKLILQLPVHLYHFTPPTLTPLVRRAGLELVDVFLTNPDALEWAFTLRAGIAAKRLPAGSATGPALIGPRPQSGERATSFRSLWASRLLPWIREHFPGYRFQVLARKGGAEPRPRVPPNGPVGWG